MSTSLNAIERQSISDIIQLITNPETSLNEVLSSKLLYIVLLSKDKRLLNSFRLRLAQELLSCVPTSHFIEIDDNDVFLSEAKIDNLLAFIAYTEPSTGDSIQIPCFNGEQFELVDFEFERINLTSDYFSAPYTCYGLVPQGKAYQQYETRLLFMGTTFPTAKGFAQALLADTAPGGGVGHYLYNQGESYLKAWINNHYTASKKPIYCIGQSLGGAMCMQTYIHQPNKVRFCAINPPFLSNAERRIFEKQTVNSNDIIEKNKIYHHVLDPVSSVGHWIPTSCKVYVHGNTADFTGSWFHRLFKAHAALINETSFTPYLGNEYLKILQSEPARMTRHYLLKPARALAFGGFWTLTSLGSIARSSVKYLGWYETQSRGPQPEASDEDSPPKPIV